MTKCLKKNVNMLRDKIYKEIISTIDSNIRYDNNDFKIVTTQEKTAVKLIITYKIDTKYYISFDIPSTLAVDGYTISGQVCPGPLALIETFKFNGKEGIYKRITVWLDCIWEELSSHPFVKTMESQQSQIDEIVEGFKSMNDTYFSVDEVQDLKARLDTLENNLKAEIEKNTEDKKAQDAQVDKLHTDIETLKETIVLLKKKGWIHSFTSKAMKWTMNSDNRKLLGDGFKVIREFLPEDVKNNLHG